MERLSAGRPLSCGSGFIFPSGIILSGNNANINAGWSLNEKGSNGQSKFAAGCKSKKKSFYITASKYFNDFRDYHFDCFTDMYIFLANDYKAY